MVETWKLKTTMGGGDSWDSSGSTGPGHTVHCHCSTGPGLTENCHCSLASEHPVRTHIVNAISLFQANQCCLKQLCSDSKLTYAMSCVPLPHTQSFLLSTETWWSIIMEGKDFYYSHTIIFFLMQISDECVSGLYHVRMLDCKSCYLSCDRLHF